MAYVGAVEGNFCLDEAEAKSLSITSIAAGATSTRGVGFYTKKLNVENFDTIGIMMMITGANASSSGNVTFNFLTSQDGTNWESALNYHTETIALNGTTDERKTVELNVNFVKFLRLESIINGDASYAVEDVQAKYFAKETY